MESYLEALAAWINDPPGWYKNFEQEMPPHGDWMRFARAMWTITKFPTATVT